MKTLCEPSYQALLDLDTFRARLQPHLEAFIDRKTRSYARFSNDPLLRSIWDYPHRLVTANGKRIRPYVAYLMYQSLLDSEPDEEGALRLLVSLELFHLFCLVHDDVIDKGTERHGLPTVHRFVSTALERGNRLPNNRSSNCDHIGNAQAILLGDMLFAWSQEAFHANRDFSCGTLHEASEYFTWMMDEVVIGEMLDVDMMTRRETSQEAISQKMLLKTATYTFIRPMQIGAALANQGRECEDFCYDLGLALGLAFQIRDDLLDIVGSPKCTQKSIFSDLREHQHTYFTQFIFDHGTAAQQAKLRQLLGCDIQATDKAGVLELFSSSGALDHGVAAVRRQLSRACALLDASPLPTPHRTPFYELIETIQGPPL